MFYHFFCHKFKRDLIFVHFWLSSRLILLLFIVVDFLSFFFFLFFHILHEICVYLINKFIINYHCPCIILLAYFFFFLFLIVKITAAYLFDIRTFILLFNLVFNLFVMLYHCTGFIYIHTCLFLFRDFI